MRTHYLLLSILAISLGCEKLAPRTGSTAPSVAATSAPASDPLGEFKVISRDFVAKAIAQQNSDFATAGSASGYTVNSDVSFDVQKTDSLISPFTADINATGEWNTDSSLGKLPVKIRYLFAYQDGKWVAKGGSYSGTYASGKSFSHDVPLPLLQLVMMNMGQ